MRYRFAVLAVFALVAMVAAPRPAAALTPELVKRGKAATALVEVKAAGDKRGFGSAFCVDAVGLFVTNAHVADAAGAGGTLSLILAPGEKSQRQVAARVVKSDREVDLALLQVQNATPADAAVIQTLELGSTDALFDTMELTAFGYPFGGALALDEKGYPSVSVNSGRITSLRKKGGELELIQVDAALNPGNSGGPMLDPSGKVVGIVMAGLPGAGINFAIPVSRLNKMLAKPLVVLTPGSLPFEKRGEETTFNVKVVSFVKPAPAYAVDLSITGPDGVARTFAGKVADGACAIKAVPVPRAAGGKTVTIVAKYADGQVSGRIAERQVKVAGAPLALSTVRRITRKGELGPAATVLLLDGKELSGTVTGLEAVPVMLGNGATATADLGKATSLQLDDGERATRSLAYKVAVKVKAELVAEESGQIALDGAPAGAPAIAAGDGGGAVVIGGTGPNDPIDVGLAIPNPGNAAVAGGGAGAPVQTALCGGTGGGPFVKLQREPMQDVVGFRFTMGDWGGRPVLREVDPLYARDPEPAKPADGRPNPRDRFRGEPAQTVLAKEGYVVGGLLVDSDDNARGMRVIFMRLDKGRPDPRDQYVSEWLGRASSGTRPKLLAGKGERVVGVWGRKGMNCDALGLLVVP